MRSGALSQSKNLVYTAPTGGGKSLVADVVLLKTVIENPSKKALLMLPYVALVQEKTKWLRRPVDGIQRGEGLNGLLQNTSKARPDIALVSFYAGIKNRATWIDCDIAVCTIEKANTLVNSAIEDSTIGDLGIVVCDEL